MSKDLQSFDSLLVKPKTPPPANLFTSCFVCGVKDLPPIALPYSGEWKKVSCQCERDERENRRRLEEQKKRVNEGLERAFGWYGMPWNREDIQASTFNAFHPEWQLDPVDRKNAEKAQKMCREYVQPKQTRPMMLYGDYGCGKSHLIRAMILKALALGITARYASVPALIVEYNRRMKNNQDAYELELFAARPRILFLDELDKLYKTDARDSFLYRIAELRNQLRLPTVCTFNNSNLDSILNEATISRLTADVIYVPLTGVDMREKVSKMRRGGK